MDALVATCVTLSVVSALTLFGSIGVALVCVEFERLHGWTAACDRVSALAGGALLAFGPVTALLLIL